MNTSVSVCNNAGERLLSPADAETLVLALILFLVLALVRALVSTLVSIPTSSRPIVE